VRIVKSITIQNDVYAYLKNEGEIGEDASSILRRLLKIPSQRQISSSSANSGTAAGSLSPCIRDARFRGAADAVRRFLFVLGWLHAKHRTEFERVLSVQGRRRRYFAKSAKELEEFGESVQPQRVPDSDFWVITNNDTPKKMRMIGDVLRVLDYSPSEISELLGAFETLAAPMIYE
jgi:negative modulator of initiation of replication